MAPPPPFVELCEAQQETKISNVIGTVIDALPPTITRKGDHMLTFTLDDGTLQRGQKCRLFAKKAHELPQINGLGDVVILKKVRYSIIGGAGLLTTIYGAPSPWAVFHSPIPKDLGIFGANPKAARYQMPTISTEEMKYVISLGQTQDHSKFTPLNDEVKAKVTAVKAPSKCLIKDLVIDSYPRIVGEVVKVFFNFERATLYITDYTENQLLYNYRAMAGSDQNDGLSSRWPGPPGKYTLLVECWPPHSQWIRENVSTGNFLQLDNVHIKPNPEHGRTEGALHASRFNEDRLRVRKLEAHDVAELLYRKEQLGWADGFDKKEDESNDEEQSKDQTDKSSKKRSRHQRRKEREKAEREAKRAKSAPDNESELQQKKSLPQSSPTVHLVNENVRCENGPWPHRSVAEIRNGSRLSNTAMKDQAAAAHLTSFATVRVVDFKPAKLEDFAKAREMTLEEQQAAEEANATASEEEGSDSDSSGAHSASSLYHNSTQVRRQIWEWKFALLLEDASDNDGKAEKDQIITYVSPANAEYLLGMKALDLRRNKQTLNRLRETMFILWGDLEERKEQKGARLLAEISTNSSSAGGSGSSQGNAVASRPFTCIIEEYGEEVRGQFSRKFRMKGTTIVRSSSPVKQETGKLDSWDEVGEDDIDHAASRDLPIGAHDAKAVSTRAPRAG